MDENGKMIGGAFLLGGVAGAVIALLYAPKSGRETRKDVSKTVRRISDDAVDLIEETIEDVTGFARDLLEKTSELVEEGADLSGRALEEIVATLEHGQKAIGRKRKKLKRALGI